MGIGIVMASQRSGTVGYPKCGGSFRCKEVLMGSGHRSEEMTYERGFNVNNTGGKTLR